MKADILLNLIDQKKYIQSEDFLKLAPKFQEMLAGGLSPEIHGVIEAIYMTLVSLYSGRGEDALENMERVKKQIISLV